MESLSIGLSSSPISPIPNTPNSKCHLPIPLTKHKLTQNPLQSHPQTPTQKPNSPNFNPNTPQFKFPPICPKPQNPIHLIKYKLTKKPSQTHPQTPPQKPNFPNFKPNTPQFLSSLFLGFELQFPQLVNAIENQSIPSSQTSPKINLEAILVSIDDFFNKYPFFVGGLVFVWLFVVPYSQEYLRKFKFVSCVDAFKKIRDDPCAQLLDIRDGKTVRIFGSPNLKVVGKSVVCVEYSGDGDDEVFVRKVKEEFREFQETSVCILDNFDGASMKVAELLFNNGFKEAYAIRGGVRGDNGWLDIQETLLPPSVHIKPKMKVKKSAEVNSNGAIEQQSEVNSQPASVSETKQTNNGYVNTSTELNTSARSTMRSSSPYPMYPDMKPPSSPTPSKPQ